MSATDVQGTGDQTQQKNAATEPSIAPGIVIDLDVGKSGHHACAPTNTDEKIYDKSLPQNEVARYETFTSIQAHSSALMVVGQHNTVSALPITVTRNCDRTVGDLPDLIIRKAADLYPRRSKTDRRNTFIITDTARTIPHTLRTVDRDGEISTVLKMFAEFHDNITRDATQTRNCLRSMLTQVHPELERIFVGEILSHTLMLSSLVHYEGRRNWPPQVEAGSWSGHAIASRRILLPWLTQLSPSLPSRLSRYLAPRQ